jgi:hypothetical protein
MANYRLFSSVSGPSAAVSYSGPFIPGVAFKVTTGGTWFNGYWWWVCDTGQPTAPQKFALWQVYDNATGSLISSATVTSESLTAGQWNYVPLPAPIPLAINVPYIAATGFTGGFPDTNSQFSSGDPYGNGITSGPLTAYSDQTGTMAAPFAVDQSPFSAAGSDPTVTMPAYGSSSSNFWMDVQVQDTAPAGASYRLWPTYPTPPNVVSIDTGAQTSATEFKLAEPCAVHNIWFYSPPGVSVLPSRTAIWDVATKAVVAGTDNTAPAWSGAGGSGWVSSAYSGVTLPAGDYKVSMYYGGGQEFYTENVFYYSTGPGADGITAGPLSTPNVANGASCISNSLGAVVTGNSTYQDGAFAYPDTFDTKDNGENRWIDIEVTPTGTTAPPPATANSGAFLVFFP